MHNFSISKIRRRDKNLCALKIVLFTYMLTVDLPVMFSQPVSHYGFTHNDRDVVAFWQGLYNDCLSDKQNPASRGQTEREIYIQTDRVSTGSESYDAWKYSHSEEIVQSNKSTRMTNKWDRGPKSWQKVPLESLGYIKTGAIFILFTLTSA